MAAFLANARAWLTANAEPRPPRGRVRWGEGSDRVALFRDTSADEERAQVDAARAWQRTKFDAGYGAINWPVRYGGAGLGPEYAQAFRHLEEEYVTPMTVEAVSISTSLQASTILQLGNETQKDRWVRSLRRGDEMC